MATTAALRPGATSIPWLLVLALLAVGGAAALVATERPVLGGTVASLAVGASILAGWGARDSDEPRLVFADHAVERVVEASLFGAVAWAAVPEDPWTAAAALTALVATYLASYLTAKAIGLGFEVQERLPFRSVRPMFAVIGLLIPPVLDPVLWAATVFSLEPVVRHSLSIARQRESE